MGGTCRKYGFNDRDVGRELSWNRVRSEADLGGSIDARARNNEAKHSLVMFVFRAEGAFTFGSVLSDCLP
jgi:hypothetical protein